MANKIYYQPLPWNYYDDIRPCLDTLETIEQKMESLPCDDKGFELYKVNMVDYDTGFITLTINPNQNLPTYFKNNQGYWFVETNEIKNIKPDGSKTIKFKLVKDIWADFVTKNPNQELSVTGVINRTSDEGFLEPYIHTITREVEPNISSQYFIVEKKEKNDETAHILSLEYEDIEELIEWDNDNFIDLNYITAPHTYLAPLDSFYRLFMFKLPSNIILDQLYLLGKKSQWTVNVYPINKWIDGSVVPAWTKEYYLVKFKCDYEGEVDQSLFSDYKNGIKITWLGDLFLDHHFKSVNSTNPNEPNQIIDNDVFFTDYCQKWRDINENEMIGIDTRFPYFKQKFVNNHNWDLDYYLSLNLPYDMGDNEKFRNNIVHDPYTFGSNLIYRIINTKIDDTLGVYLKNLESLTFPQDDEERKIKKVEPRMVQIGYHLTTDRTKIPFFYYQGLLLIPKSAVRSNLELINNEIEIKINKWIDDDKFLSRVYNYHKFFFFNIEWDVPFFYDKHVINIWDNMNDFENNYTFSYLITATISNKHIKNTQTFHKTVRRQKIGQTNVSLPEQLYYNSLLDNLSQKKYSYQKTNMITSLVSNVGMGGFNVAFSSAFKSQFSKYYTATLGASLVANVISGGISLAYGLDYLATKRQTEATKFEMERINLSTPRYSFPEITDETMFTKTYFNNIKNPTNIIYYRLFLDQVQKKYLTAYHNRYGYQTSVYDKIILRDEMFYSISKITLDSLNFINNPLHINYLRDLFELGIFII